MKVREVPVAEAVGHVLLHNVADRDGRRVLAKGRRLGVGDVTTLQEAGALRVYVAVLGQDDREEDAAARELADALAGPGLEARPAEGGRVDLFAETDGLFEVRPDALLALNGLPGIAVATARSGMPVAAGKRVVSAKIVPYAIPAGVLDAARRICSGGGGAPIVCVRPYVVRSAVLITTGREELREEVAEAFGGPLGRRLAALGVAMTRGPHASEEEGAILRALRDVLARGAGMVLLAGSTSITDEDDVIPRAIRSAGAEIVRYGVPVEPGNLLLLAFRGETAIVGVPGCARGRGFNAFDLILPRLVAGERLGSADLVALGHGGLLE